LATIAVTRRQPRQHGLAAAHSRATLVHRVLTMIAFVAIYVVLIKVLHLNLILSRTTAAGGDMGSHHYIDTFLRKDLLPHWRLTGWAPGWFGGIPMLTFYFPLPYLAIVALTPLLGSQIAFKVITALGPMLLPLTCWAAFRVLRLREPAPLLAACASVVFLLMSQVGPAQTDQFQIWGGNIASTMAGEFPFALSFALLPLALALTYRAVEDGKGWRLASVITAGVVLTHILTTISLLIGSTMLLLRLPLAAAGRALWRLARIYALAFCLTAFWGLTFIVRQPYTAHMKWDQLTNYSYLLPTTLRPYLVLTAIGLVAAIMRGERRILLFAWPAMVAAFVFVALPQFVPAGALWNARLLPLVYLCELLLAAYGAAVVVGRVVGALQRGVRLPVPAAYVLVVLVVALAPIAASYPGVGRSNNYVSGWTDYNYSGFEVKPGWPEATALFSTLNGLPEGRVMWEFNRDYERFGTTRTLENIPVFTKQPTMEGLLIESSLNAPFHFINQAETSQTATQAVPGVQYPGFDFSMGLRHLRMFGIRWYVAYTDQVKQAAKAAGLPVVATSGKFTIYQVGDGHLVEVPPYRPVLFDDPDWRESSLTWYRNPDWLDTPLAFASRSDKAAMAAFADPGKLPVSTLPKQALARPGTIPSTMTDQAIDFTTDRIGEPHIVKVSYFPNWHAEGAKGPWLLSPGLMVVVPTQAHVRLVYRDTPVETSGKALTAAGLGILVLPVLPGAYRRYERRWRRRAGDAADPAE
jgi:6-pyruvoyl-tetrahydropterin synthase related domain